MIWLAIILGVIEGLTEFLPISSTGHLILAGYLMGFTGQRAADLLVVIQLGAILAVVYEYRDQLGRAVSGFSTDASSRGLLLNLALGVLPAMVAGALLHGPIEKYLFGPVTVAGALVAGGVAILIIERVCPAARLFSIGEIPWRVALAIGLAQTLALFPGVSRAAATILGGMLSGLSRRAATEFSFYLAIPTMLAATAFQLINAWGTIPAQDAMAMVIGAAVAFVAALLAVRGFIGYVARHTLAAFAWYRIALGLAVAIWLS